MCILETATEDLFWSLLLPAERLLLPAKAADGHGMLASCPRWHDFTVKFPAADCSSDAGSPLGDRKPVPPWLLPLVQVPVLKGTRGELQPSLLGPKNTLLSGGHCCWAHAVAFLAQPPLQARPSGLLPTKLKFSQNNYVDFYRETFSRCDALPLVPFVRQGRHWSGGDLHWSSGHTQFHGLDVQREHDVVQRNSTETWRCLQSRAVVFNLWLKALQHHIEGQ